MLMISIPRISLGGAICKVESYGIGDNADIKAENIELLHEPGKIGLHMTVQDLLI